MLRSFLVFLLPVLWTLSAFPTENLNYLDCIYTSEDVIPRQWKLRNYAGPVAPSLSLPENLTKFLYAAYTSKAPLNQNHAACLTWTGSQGDDVVTMTSTVFSGTSFSPVPPIVDPCRMEGVDVKTLSRTQQTLARGSFVDTELSWMPPENARELVRVYFPTVEELNRTQDWSEKRCLELAPTSDL